ncbi:MAG TPA: protease complex subunit PrcB family protein [Thermoanaerobacterales bacterium]|nr:protease complex subunit PrcB family protein [Thermoanaerobacterales bacterium]
MNNKNKILLIILTIITLITVPGYGDNGNQVHINGGLLQLPNEIVEWIEYSKEIFIAQTYEYEDDLYVFVSYGEKPTGGYTVEITDIDEKSDALEVVVNFTQPNPDDNVTHAITYPYDMKVVEPTDKEIIFIAEGSESYVPTLLYIDKLEPIVAGKKGIMVFEPAPESETGKSINFRGIANTFEGTVNYRIETLVGDELLEGYTTGAMMDWGYFEENIEIPNDAPSELSLIIFTYSAKDGSVEDEFEIPLTVK